MWVTLNYSSPLVSLPNVKVWIYGYEDLQLLSHYFSIPDKSYWFPETRVK